MNLQMKSCGAAREGWIGHNTRSLSVRHTCVALFTSVTPEYCLGDLVE